MTMEPKIRWLVGISISGDNTAKIIVTECEIKDNLNFSSPEWQWQLNDWMAKLNIYIAHVFIDKPDIDTLAEQFSLSISGEGPTLRKLHQDNIEYVHLRPLIQWMGDGVA